MPPLSDFCILPAAYRLPPTFMDTRTDIQFSVFLVNKPGVLAQVTGALGEAKPNSLAMPLPVSEEHGVPPPSPDPAPTPPQLLARLNFPMTETEVLCLDLS